MIDGAHAVGQIPLQLRSLCSAGVDYYVTNVHKWCYAPKGCAVLYARDPPGVTPLRPLIVSSEYNRATDLQRRFDYVGTRDYTAYCVLPAVLAFRRGLGDEAVFRYLHGLAAWGGHYLATLWSTELMCPDSMVAAMFNVRLPTTDAGAWSVPRMK